MHTSDEKLAEILRSAQVAVSECVKELESRGYYVSCHEVEKGFNPYNLPSERRYNPKEEYEFSIWKNKVIAEEKRL